MNPLPTDGNVRCLTCGYLLHGLPRPLCPECGRAFDPSDESTFDTRPPGWRKRRRIKRGASALAVGLLLFAFAPRGILKGELTFTCNVCGEQTTVHRRELESPRWMPFRYPSWYWTSRAQATSAAPSPSCDQHVYDMKVAFDFGRGNHATATMVGAPGKDTTFNGRVATVETANDVLQHLMSPTNNGIGP